MLNKIDLPFLWGAATSAHQVEGNNGANDWWAWEQAGKVKETSGAACDQYHRFHEDFETISSLGHTAHRFSLEWSRFEPRENEWDNEAFRHYEEIFKELRARQIEPIVTLHHFTNPVWFTNQGGWLAPDSVRYFARYVERMVKAYGPYVRYWITINEPLIYLYHSFYAGLWPPGLTSFHEALQVFRHMLRAHLEAYKIIHGHYETELKRPVAVSVAHHMTHFTPCRPFSLKDRWAIFLRDWFANSLFFDAAVSGFLFFPGMFCEALPVRRSLDFLGVNYYSRDFIRFAGWTEGNSIGAICDKEHHGDRVQELNMMGWDIYPEGFYRILLSLKRFHLPILVCENGVCTQDDRQRVRFIQNHLEVLGRARRDGVPVLGYLYWSLVDNFEWAHGFGPRFGIVEVDFKTQERKIRESAQVLSRSCRQLASKG